MRKVALSVSELIVIEQALRLRIATIVNINPATHAANLSETKDLHEKIKKAQTMEKQHEPTT